MGTAVDADEFSRICLGLQERGAENINVVTGSHAIPRLARFLSIAKANGLTIPILWNSSAYETPEALELLRGIVDVWLPDLKTLNPVLSRGVFGAEDYPRVAKRAIKRMTEISPLRYGHGRDGESEVITGGVIVRHLALPGRIADTRLTLEWFAEHLAQGSLLSLMTQYTPVGKSPRAGEIDEFENRLLDKEEFEGLTDLLEELGIEGGFYQELSGDTEWLPDFTRDQPFSSALARPTWHWKSGFISH
jgi:putative pyruvate formate lyase activating enzyme